MDNVVLSEVGEVISSIPAMLGFYPTDSLVLISFVGSQARPMVIRADLCNVSMADQVWLPIESRRLAEPVQAVMAIVVGGGDILGHRDLVTALRDHAQRTDIPFVFAAWVDSIAAGNSWFSYTDSSHGTLADPKVSHLAVLAAYEGSVVRSSRDAIAASFQPAASPSVLANRRERIKRWTLDLEAVPAEDVVREATAKALDGVLPETDDQFAVLVAALDIGPARDQAIRAMLDGEPALSMALWQRVLCNVDDDHQRHPATMLAVASFLNSDGATACVAVELACRWSLPGSLPYLLQHAIQLGISPDEFREIVASAVEPAP